MSALLLIVIAAVCNALALTMLKVTGDQLKVESHYLVVLEKTWVYLVFGVLLYGASFLLAIKIFSINSFSRTVPVFVGLNILSSLAIASFYFKEAVSFSLLLGSVFIIVGVWLIQENSL